MPRLRGYSKYSEAGEAHSIGFVYEAGTEKGAMGALRFAVDSELQPHCLPVDGAHVRDLRFMAYGGTGDRLSVLRFGPGNFFRDK